MGVAADFLAIPGILLAIYLFRLGLPSTELSWSVETTKVFSENVRTKIKYVRIHFGDKEISKLYQTVLVVWNSGNNALRRENFSETGKLCFEIRQSKVLTLEIVDEKLPQQINKIHVTKKINDYESYYFDFEYLNPGEGFIVEIFHDEEPLGGKIRAKLVGPSPRIRQRPANAGGGMNAFAFSLGVLSTAILGSNLFDEVNSSTWVQQAWLPLKIFIIIFSVLLLMAISVIMGAIVAFMIEIIVSGRKKNVPQHLLMRLLSKVMPFRSIK